jgi:hypothetical protein
MFRNKIPEPCWIPEEPHQEVWNRTIGGDREQRRWRGSVAYLSIHRSVDQVGRHCDLLFIAWRLAHPHQHATREDLNPTGFKPSFVLALGCPSVRQSRAMMLAAATAGSFIASNATVASIAVIVIVVSIAAIGNLVTWAWVGAALRNWLWHRLAKCEPSMSRWARSSPRPHCGWRRRRGHSITSAGNRRGRSLYCSLLFLGALSSSC